MSAAATASIQAARLLCTELETVLDALRQAVIRGDHEQVAELVPQEEALMRRLAGLRLPEGADPSAVLELRDAASRVTRLNTQNSILLREQLALIQETIRLLVGDGRAVDRMA